MFKLLRLEGLALLALGLYGFHWQHGNWLFFGLLLLSPDITMIGYLKSSRFGAFTYNLGHSMILPTALLILSVANQWLDAFLFACIWLAHLGIDRVLGYGLKYSDKFSHTHLGSIGKDS